MTTPRVRFMHLAPAEDGPAVEAAVRRVIDRGWYVLGPEVKPFEQAFARACGATHSVGVGTGTDAIAIILRCLGIGAGDEVITTPLSAAYTALACMMALLIAEISPPVLKSITVSAPKSMAVCNFLNSVFKSQKSEDVPMLALTLVLSPLPIPQGIRFV